jgi:ubiquinone/menaquinone biosynthesis C-methylase UbiE
MTDHFRDIYARRAEEYDAMVSREDYQGNILPALARIQPLAGLDVVELGAGTGRLTRLLAPLVGTIRAFDASRHMLDIARLTLAATGASNWILRWGDNKALPVEADSADLCIAGWTLGHACGWYPDRWQGEIGAALAEIQRVLRPGGTAIILETLGTGHATPTPPSPTLAAYYHWLENDQGFDSTWIRTDYRFESVQEADELTRFFFGDDLADRIVREQLIIVPECTGIWWRRYNP